MKAALDTNVLAYAEGVDDPFRQHTAQALVADLDPLRTVIPVQVLGELFSVLTRKGLSRDVAHQVVLSWEENGELAPTTTDVFAAAVGLALRHKLQIWDCVILSAAADAGCTLLLSEDMRHGSTFAGVTIINPFSATRHPLLRTLLES